ncbi:MAG: cyclopropane-fatty-acyl-phospholipid synthase [Verrucomicrobiales bacterium]
MEEEFMKVAELLEAVLGTADIPVHIAAYDGSTLGPPDAATTLRFVSPDAVHRIITARGKELGFARAIIAGDIEIEGDIFGIFEINRLVENPNLDRSMIRPAAELIGIESVRDLAKLRPLPPPPEEIRLSGKLHSRQRDAEAISSHYDVSNEFYDLVLGTSMTYSCAVFDSADDDLVTAQSNKHDLICRKLALEPGMRHLDIGCGWGSMVIHAARNYGVHSVGVTISQEQAERARKRVADEGLSEQIEIRVQDYRDVSDGPFDAISSIGMAEHVGGQEKLREYFQHVRSLLAPEGRYLNHAIGRSPKVTYGDDGFIQRYVFPDGELHELGETTTALQEAGFEARHMESFRLHYARTLRQWVENLESNWDAAVTEVGLGRATIWRIYMAGSAVGFEQGDLELHHVLAIPHETPNDSVPFRQSW